MTLKRRLLDDQGNAISCAASIGRVDDEPATEAMDAATVIALLKTVIQRLDTLIELESGA